MELEGALAVEEVQVEVVVAVLVEDQAMEAVLAQEVVSEVELAEVLVAEEVQEEEVVVVSVEVQAMEMVLVVVVV